MQTAGLAVTMTEEVTSNRTRDGRSGGVGVSESRETESCMISLFVDQEGKKQGTTVGYIKSSTSSM
jgi:hypothetical protein